MTDPIAALARAIPRSTDGSNRFPEGTELGGHSYGDWARWYQKAAANMVASLHAEGLVLVSAERLAKLEKVTRRAKELSATVTIADQAHQFASLDLALIALDEEERR